MDLFLTAPLVGKSLAFSHFCCSRVVSKPGVALGLACSSILAGDQWLLGEWSLAPGNMPFLPTDRLSPSSVPAAFPSWGGVGALLIVPP